LEKVSDSVGFGFGIRHMPKIQFSHTSTLALRARQYAVQILSYSEKCIPTADLLTDVSSSAATEGAAAAAHGTG